RGYAVAFREGIEPLEMKFHPESLAPIQLDVLRALGPAADKEGFYLAGGTALAIQLGHRRSVDFDWFKHELPEPMAIPPRLVAAGVPFETRRTERGTLHGTVKGVSASFIE